MLGCSRPLTAQVDELPLFGPGLSGGDDRDGDLEAGRRPSGISKPDRRTKHPCFGPRPCGLYRNMKTPEPGPDPDYAWRTACPRSMETTLYDSTAKRKSSASRRAEQIGREHAR